MLSAHDSDRGTVVIAGVGPGLGASLCRTFAKAGFAVAGLARSIDFGKALNTELADAGSRFAFFECDVTDAESVAAATGSARERFGTFSALVYNAGAVKIAPFANTSPADFERLWQVCCLGGVHAAQAVLSDLLARGQGTMIFTGATASLRGGANFAAFAAAKFALRGLSQSLAREHGPNGIHVAHVIVDGLIWGAQSRDRFGAQQTACLDPDAMAAQYLNLADQNRSAWTHELDLRPFSEKF